MAFVTKDQKLSTVAKILYENYICNFGTPVQMHSDWGANFTSTIITELCSLLGFKSLRLTHIALKVMDKWDGCTKP